MGDGWGGVVEAFMSPVGRVVTEWVKCLHQFRAIIMSKGEGGAWRWGTSWRRRRVETYLHTTSVFIFKHTHTPCSCSPSSQAGQFTVRLFNFPEIGLWQLCHADEKVLRRVAACHISSISTPLPLNLLLHLCCSLCFFTPPKISNLSSK